MKTSQLINVSDYKIAYRSISSEIEERVDKLNETIKEVDEGISEYHDFGTNEILKEIRAEFPVEILNLLPSYFQSQRNAIAERLNLFQLKIDQEFGDTALCLALVDYLLDLRLTSAKIGRFQENREILYSRFTAEKEREINRPILQKWAKEVADLRAMAEHIENKKMTAPLAWATVNEQIDFQELNFLGSFADEIRMQVASELRNISVTCWNSNQNIIEAISFLEKAIQIRGLLNDLVQGLQKDKRELNDLKRVNAHLLTCHFCKNNPPFPNLARRVKIYKVYNRSWYGNKRQVQYHTSEISVPQCADCAVLAHKSIKNSAIIMIASAVAGFITALAMQGEHFVLGATLGLLVGFITGKIYKHLYYKERGLKVVSESSYKLIKEKLNQGWQLNQPSS